ncbi:hypothetical protein, partial [Verminephrobacter aporrectodeae]|uniref:hypothetical protein n=1 Tax=Verminephrobacter aporrectodeae TaxID=1110389 RepID=UPI001F29CC6B
MKFLVFSHRAHAGDHPQGHRGTHAAARGSGRGDVRPAAANGPGLNSRPRHCVAAASVAASRTSAPAAMSSSLAYS